MQQSCVTILNPFYSSGICGTSSFDSYYGWSEELDEIPGKIIEECCLKLKVTLQNGPEIAQGLVSGDYTLNTNKINGKYYWNQDNGDWAIWYNNNSWLMGIESNLGTDIAAIYLVTIAQCPHNVNQPWNYLNIDGEWLNADKNVQVDCFAGKHLKKLFSTLYRKKLL